MKKRKFLPVIFTLVFVIMLSSCSTHSSKSATFTVETGDSIKVTVDTKAGFDLTMEVPFTISKESTPIITGSFAYAEYYDTFRQSVDENTDAELLDEGIKDGSDYFLYSVTDGDTYGYYCILKVCNSETLVVLESLTNEENITDALDYMTFGLGDD